MKDRLADQHGDLWDDPRRRARVILLILAMTAVLVAAIMVFFVGTSGGRHNTGLGNAGPSTGSATATGHRATGTRAATTSRAPSQSRSTSAAAKPTSTANPCPSANPCAVPGDSGAAVAAVNKFRTSHGRPAVSGAATAQAQQCALGQGSGPTCQPHYAWQPVATQDGTAAVAKIAQQDGGRWLLDPAMTSFSVGWAYTPGAGGGPGSYQFALLKIG